MRTTPVLATTCQEWRERFRTDTTLFAIATDTGYTRVTIREHVAGECDHSDIGSHPNAADIGIQAAECRQIRARFTEVESITQMVKESGHCRKTIIKHLTGACNHSNSGEQAISRYEISENEQISASQCAEFRRNAVEYDNLAEYTKNLDLAYYTVAKHVKGRCSHEIDVSPLPTQERAGQITAAECNQMRKQYRSGPDVTTSEVATEWPHSEQTIQRHILFLCDHPPDSLLVTDVRTVQDLLSGAQ